MHNFDADKAKIRRRAAARQGFLTQYAAKFAEKTCAYAYEDRFLHKVLLFYTQTLHFISIKNALQKRPDVIKYYQSRYAMLRDVSTQSMAVCTLRQYFIISGFCILFCIS